LLSKNEFEILHFCHKQNGPVAQRAIAEGCNLSIGTTNQVLRKLEKAGLIDANYKLTKAAYKALKPYKVDNAIIMAAGFSSRFAPVSFERPKGVLTVRGEVLIERQIRQLHEVGITDITVVVGYRKEEFFYLEDLLGVKIVVNEEYAKRNNNSTLYKVQDSLSNTYVCSSDNYFVINPFEEYVYKAYYATIFIEGETDEYCVVTRGKERAIVDVVLQDGKNMLAMLGHTYWDREFSSNFVKILNDIYDEPSTAGKLWEDIYAEHLNKLKMVAREYSPDDIWEFDSLDELKGFDEAFLNNVDSEIMDNICAVLDCKREDISHFSPVKQGVTNLTVKFQVAGKQYVYRHPKASGDNIVNHESEAYSEAIAKKLGIDETFIHEDPKAGWKIARFMDNCVPFDYHNNKHVKQAMKIARTLHESGETSPWKTDLFKKANDIIKLLGTPSFTGFDELAKRMKRLHGYVKNDGSKPVICHNDLYDTNFLVYGKNMALIDWEYSAMSDYASDLGTFICSSDYDIAKAREVVKVYFGRTPTDEEMRHCMAYVALAAYYWFIWALYKDATSEPMGEWLYLWYRKAKEFGTYAEELYNA